MATKKTVFTEKLLQRVVNEEFVNGAYLPCERDLAVEYGLSRGTVRKGLQALLEKQILRLDSKRGYMVSQIPTQVDRTARNIGCIWCSGARTDHTYSLYHAAGKEAQKNGLKLFVRQIKSDDREQAAYLDEILELRPDGLLIIPTFSERSNRLRLGNHQLLLALRHAGIPLVLLDRDFQEEDLPCVVNDEKRGGAMAAEHFAAHGHRNILVLEIEYNYYISNTRNNSFQKKCKDMGIDPVVYRIPVAEDLWTSYLQNRSLIRKQFKSSSATAMMVSLPVIADDVLDDLMDSGGEFLIYGNLARKHDSEKIWYVDRPIDTIAEEAMKLLEDEIRCGARGLVRQYRLCPEIKIAASK